MYKDKWRNYFFPAKPIEIPQKWTLLRQVGKDILSLKAQEKLEWVIFYYTIAKKNLKAKVRIHTLKEQLKQVKEFGFLWHIDAIIIWWYGQRGIIFTAIEELTKIAFAKCYKTNTSGFAEDFLRKLMYLADGKINIIHSNNGSEFQGAFERACKTLGILQVYSRPHTPKDNPVLEKFNNTIQREWLSLSEIGLDDIEKTNRDLTKLAC